MADPLPEPNRCLSCGDELHPGYPHNVCPGCLRRMGEGLLTAQTEAEVEDARG